MPPGNKTGLKSGFWSCMGGLSDEKTEGHRGPPGNETGLARICKNQACGVAWVVCRMRRQRGTGGHLATKSGWRASARTRQWRRVGACIRPCRMRGGCPVAPCSLDSASAGLGAPPCSTSRAARNKIDQTHHPHPCSLDSASAGLGAPPCSTSSAACHKIDQTHDQGVAEVAAHNLEPRRRGSGPLRAALAALHAVRHAYTESHSVCTAPCSLDSASAGLGAPSSSTSSAAQEMSYWTIRRAGCG